MSGVAAHGREHDVGQPPLEAAQGFAFGFAGGSFAFVVGPAFGVAANLGDRDRVERAVELPVPAGIEPAGRSARRTREAPVGPVWARPLCSLGRSLG